MPLRAHNHNSSLHTPPFPSRQLKWNGIQTHLAVVALEVEVHALAETVLAQHRLVQPHHLRACVPGQRFAMVSQSVNFLKWSEEAVLAQHHTGTPLPRLRYSPAVCSQSVSGHSEQSESAVLTHRACITISAAQG